MCTAVAIGRNRSGGSCEIHRNPSNCNCNRWYSPATATWSPVSCSCSCGRVAVFSSRCNRTSKHYLLCIPCPIYLLNQNWSVGRGKYDLLVPGRKLWKELWDFYMWARFWALHIIRHWDTIGYWAWFNGSRAMTRISHIQWCMISEGNSWSIHEVLVVHSACSATKVIPNFQ